MSGRAVIVGASLGGLRAVQQLRAAGWTGAITVVGAEPHPPYNRPPLSKAVLRGLASASAPLLPAGEALETVALPLRVGAGDVAWRLGTEVRGADLAGRALELADGETLGYDALVVATGLRPRRLPLPGGDANRYVLRTLDDAARLAPALVPGARVVVVGAGFVGCELAATACELGCRVALVEAADVPLAGALGGELAGALRRAHEAHGIAFHTGRQVRALACDADGARVEQVVLDDGNALAADVVVEAIGSRPNVEWLEGNGLDLSDGVLCDGRMRVEGRPEVVAVGDVARFPNAFVDEIPRRVEHWCVPAETARHAAATLAAGAGAGGGPGAWAGGTARPRAGTDGGPGAAAGGAARAGASAAALLAFLPSFWSDQLDLRIQALGMPGLADERVLLEGDLDDLRAGVAVGARRGGRLVGVTAIGLAPAALSRYRAELTGGEALAA